MGQKRKILVAPLDWGLGHATRVIPIIRELLVLQAEVLIGGDGPGLLLLQKEFPGLKSIRIPGYRVRYHKRMSVAISILLQLPGMIRSVYSEHKLLKEIIDAESIDAVISDNRYGLYSKDIACIFITHQLKIRVPFPFHWVGALVNRINHFLINKFDACWIPDFEGEKNLSGELSHLNSRPAHAIFIGPLTRFSRHDETKQYKLLVLLSGPEPQRSELEQLLQQEIDRHFRMADDRLSAMEAQSLHQPLIMMVRGVMNGLPRFRPGSFKMLYADYLLTEALNDAILAAEVVIARPGYSTVMDLAALGSQAIFIPTPGQTEQEYLAHYLMDKGCCYASAQATFNLSEALNAARSYRGLNVEPGSKWKLLLHALLQKKYPAS